MKELCDVFAAIFERGGFFLVPILSIMALFNLSELNNNRIKKSFLLIAAISFLGYLPFAAGSARYILIPLLTVGILAGAGATAPIKYLHMIKPLRCIKAQHLLIFFTVLAVSSSCLKLALHDHTTTLGEFVNKLKNSPQDIKLYSVDNSYGVNVAQALRKHSNIHFYNFNDWDSAIHRLMLDQAGTSDIQFFARIPSEYTPADLLMWIRGKYYLAPLETLHSTKERSNCFVLLKFNGKILDGEQKSLRTNALAALPETLQIKDYRDWGILPVKDYLPGDTTILYEPGNGTSAGSGVLFRKSRGSLPERSKLQLRNALNWLEAEREFNLSLHAPAPQPVSFMPVNGKLSNADAPPLITPADKIFIAQNQRSIHLSGANAFWTAEDKRFEFSPQGEKHPAMPGDFSYTVKDTVLNTASSARLTVIQEDLRELNKLRGNILLLQDPYGVRLQLPENLRKLTMQTVIHSISIFMDGRSSQQSLLDSSLPSGNFDLVMLNIFADNFVRNWTIPLAVDPFMDEHLNNLIKKLEQQYPRAVIALVLPPPPPAGDNLYALLNSVKSARLAHYHAVSAIYRWFQRNKNERVEILPLYFSIDPDTGYIFDNKSKKLYSGFTFSESAQKIMAENSAAFFIHLYKTKGIFR